MVLFACAVSQHAVAFSRCLLPGTGSVAILWQHGVQDWVQNRVKLVAHDPDIGLRETSMAET